MSNGIEKLRELGGHLVDPDLAVMIFEAMPHAIVLVDPSGMIRYLNRQTEIVFGYPRAELFDQPVHMLLPEHLRERHALYVSAFYADPRPRPDMDLVAMNKDGETIGVEVSLSPIAAPQGKFTLATIRKRQRGDPDAFPAR